jgi:hypothetical protein
MKDGMKGNPDKGPQMKEGPHHFDKGYMSDSEHFSPEAGSSDDHYRGNRYMDLQNEIVRKDTKKMRGDKFSKIA